MANFILDWTKKNHRNTVTKALGKRFNQIRYDLHKMYKHYETHEEALANVPTLVSPSTWVKLCARWSISEFKNEMVALLSKLEPEKRTKDATASIFREVLGHRPGYSRGLGEMVIPESSHQNIDERFAALTQRAEQCEKDAKYYKNQFEAMEQNIVVCGVKDFDLEGLNKHFMDIWMLLNVRCSSSMYPGKPLGCCSIKLWCALLPWKGRKQQLALG